MWVIITKVAFFLLLSCGFEPIYSKKKLEKNYNFTISNIGFSGDSSINQNIKNNLINYVDNPEKPVKYDLIISSSVNKTITDIINELNAALETTKNAFINDQSHNNLFTNPSITASPLHSPAQSDTQ